MQYEGENKQLQLLDYCHDLVNFQSSKMINLCYHWSRIFDEITI